MDQDQSYEWHFLTNYPANYRRGPFRIAWFHGLIRETEEASLGFDGRLRLAALDALTADNLTLIRQGLQCLATVRTHKSQSQRTPLFFGHPTFPLSSSITESTP